MDPRATYILEELLEIDPTIGSNPDFLRIVEMMVEHKPKVKLREGFEKELKSKIWRHAELVSAPLQFSRDPEIDSIGRTFWLFSWKRASYFSTGLAFAVFAIFAYRQLDFWPTQNKNLSPVPTALQLPVSERALRGHSGETDTKSFFEMTPSDSQVLGTKNMSSERGTAPKESTFSKQSTKVTSEPRLLMKTTPASETLVQQDKTMMPQTPQSAPQAISSTTNTQDFGSQNTLGANAPPTPMTAKIAASKVRFSFTGNFPDIEPIQIVTISASGNISTQDFPTKSLEVIQDELAKGGYYKDNFVFDGTIRTLEKPRIETLTIKKNNETYTLNAIVFDVVDSDRNSPKTITVILAEGI